MQLSGTGLSDKDRSPGDRSLKQEPVPEHEIPSARYGSFRGSVSPSWDRSLNASAKTVCRSDEQVRSYRQIGYSRARFAPRGLSGVQEPQRRAFYCRGIAKSAYALEEREAMAESRDKGKKRAAGGAGGRPNTKKPPRYPRQQSKSWRPPRCVICGREHRVSSCSQHDGKCYKCGQPGHLIPECPSWKSSAPTAASAPSTPRQLAGLPPAMSAGRASSPHQSEGSRVPSGRVFATQLEEQPATPDDIVAELMASK
uniref:CCHC-type domain-containing protein n=1 Tax=Ananas comosus var. bracteatus TaxID=296719 RepID=A0A6V7PH83_ANACO|nr:unnamed protein product [Ananas comosus var. bracteatus]